MKYWNARTRSLSPYIPGEQPRGQVFIKLNTNENPYPPSPKVLEAIQHATGETLRLYPDPESTDLREAIADAYGVKPSQVFAGNGSDEVLAFAFGAFFQEDLLFPEVTYSFYPVYADLWEIPYRAIPLKEDFSIDPDHYITPSGGVVLANPNAPTGMALPPENLRRIVEYHAREERVVLIDEAYGIFADPDIRDGQLPNATAESIPPKIGALSMVSCIDEYPNLLTVHTLSKMGSLAGLRVGFAIGNEELIEGLRRIRDSFNSYPLDRLAQAGGAAALRDMPYYKKIAATIISTRNRVIQKLHALGFEVLPSQGNFIFARKPETSGAALQAFLREQGILVRRFNKSSIEDFLRITIGTDEDMDALLKTLAAFDNTGVSL